MALQRIWWLCLWTRTPTYVFEIHLLHALHLQVNLDVLVQLRFSWMCTMVFQQRQAKPFFCQTAFCIFESCMSFFSNFVEKKNVFGISEKFVMLLKWFGNVFGDVGEFNNCEFTTMKLGNIFWYDENPCDSAATLRTGQLKEDQHSTVHVAWQTRRLRRFPVWKRIECLCSENRCFWGSVLLKHSTWWGRPQRHVRERLVVAIRSCWIFAGLASATCKTCWWLHLGLTH